VVVCLLVMLTDMQSASYLLKWAIHWTTTPLCDVNMLDKQEVKRSDTAITIPRSNMPLMAVKE
jgi:hypothetical protein